MVRGDHMQYTQISYPPGGVTHKLENNYGAEVLTQEWKLWALGQTVQPGSLVLGGGVPQSSWALVQNFTELGETEILLWHTQGLSQGGKQRLQNIQTAHAVICKIHKPPYQKNGQKT